VVITQHTVDEKNIFFLCIPKKCPSIKQKCNPLKTNEYVTLNINRFAKLGVLLPQQGYKNRIERYMTLGIYSKRSAPECYLNLRFAKLHVAYTNIGTTFAYYRVSKNR